MIVWQYDSMPEAPIFPVPQKPLFPNPPLFPLFPLFPKTPLFPCSQKPPCSPVPVLFPKPIQIQLGGDGGGVFEEVDEVREAIGNVHHALGAETIE